MKIITGRRHWVLTEESPRLTTMGDNNTLTVFAGYYTRRLIPLSAFLNGVAGIHPGLISLNEIMNLSMNSFWHAYNAIRYATIFLLFRNNFPAVTSLFPIVN